MSSFSIGKRSRRLCNFFAAEAHTHSLLCCCFELELQSLVCVGIELQSSSS